MEALFFVKLTIPHDIMYMCSYCISALLSAFHFYNHLPVQGVGGQSALGSLMLTLSGRLLVDGDVVVTGRVGRERMVKLSQQVVLLDQSTQVSGKVVN